MNESRKATYPCVEVNLKKLRHNAEVVYSKCAAMGISVSAVIKGFNGIPEVTREYSAAGCAYIASSRFEHLIEARENGIPGPYMAIRVPMISEAAELVSCADYSLNSELSVVEAINKEAIAQNKTHGVILMADLGDLREGYWDKEQMIKDAIHIEKELSNVELSGVGTNLGCYGSIVANPEKMNELIAIAEEIEKAIGRELKIISGGASTSYTMVLDGTMPKRINHLRIGEQVALARDLDEFFHLDLSDMHQDTFLLKAEVIEVKDKPSYPVGELSIDCFGNIGEYVDRGIRKRALLGIGKLDFAFQERLYPTAKGIEMLGGSSDHLILDIEENQDNLKPGDILSFELGYAQMAYLTASRYVHTYCVAE